MSKFTQKLFVQNTHKIYFLMQFGLSQHVPVINSALNCYSSNLYLSEFHQTINAKTEFEVSSNLKFLMVDIRTLLYRTTCIIFHYKPAMSPIVNPFQIICPFIVNTWALKQKVFLQIPQNHRKHSCSSFFLTKLQDGNVMKETLAPVCCGGFCKVLRTRILRNTYKPLLLYSNTFNTVIHQNRIGNWLEMGKTCL